MDIETRVLINNDIDKNLPNHKPVCISTFDGSKINNFFITDFPNSEKLIESAIKSLMIPKYNRYIVILHNFSYFDGILIFRHLTTLAIKIETIQREGRLIETKVIFGKNYYISFRDSFLLLPSSLDNLAITFNVENKGYSL
jgi:hypothetical protein